MSTSAVRARRFLARRSDAREKKKPNDENEQSRLRVSILVPCTSTLSLLPSTNVQSSFHRSTRKKPKTSSTSCDDTSNHQSPTHFRTFLLDLKNTTTRFRSRTCRRTVVVEAPLIRLRADLHAAVCFPRDRARAAEPGRARLALAGRPRGSSARGTVDPRRPSHAPRRPRA